MCVWYQSGFAVAVSETCEVSMSAWIVFNWLYWLLMKSQLAVNWLVMLSIDLATFYGI